MTDSLFDSVGEPSDAARPPVALARPVEIVRLPAAPLRQVKPTIEEQFVAFHAAHPEVFERLVDLARQAERAGFRRIGMKRLYEVLRWQVQIDRGDEEFALNNNFTSRYARLLVVEHPELAHLFETRKLRSA